MEEKPTHIKPTTKYSNVQEIKFSPQLFSRNHIEPHFTEHQNIVKGRPINTSIFLHLIFRKKEEKLKRLFHINFFQPIFV
jgi:hypothetical protein